MNITDRINAFAEAGERLNERLNHLYDNQDSVLMKMLQQANELNPWFTISNQVQAIYAILKMLDKNKLEAFVADYPELQKERNLHEKIAVIMAGNIPMVGFHDLLCVLISGNKLIAKCAADDRLLIPYFCNVLTEINPGFNDFIFFADKISDMDAVIATGSNNSARYFEYYFGKYPHIIRKNRNAVAILTGRESKEELAMLGNDIFSYFGMGCRNVTKMYIPAGYDFGLFFSAIEKYTDVINHHKYMNSYDYNSAVLLMKQVPFLTNNFLILMENSNFSSPVSVLHYEFYADENHLKSQLENNSDQIQCIIGSNERDLHLIPFGKSQEPGLNDYADGIDVMKFMLGLHK